MPILANVIQDAFSPLITVFEEIMVFIHANIVGGSWGLSIVGLTVLIRAILVPLTYRQLKGMQELQRHAPELSKLKERYKDDKERQQQEMMKYYKEHGINPLASCLPLLLQFPVFISLFYMLRTDLKKHICGTQLLSYYNAHGNLATKYKAASHIGSVAHLPGKFIEQTTCNTVAPHSAKFLFLPDITNKATGVALIVLIVLYVGSQLASTFIATATTDSSQRWLFLLIPVVFVVILYRYPAGLLVYWITTNLWTIGQQYLIKRRLPPPEKPASSSNGKPTRSLRQSIVEAAGGAASPAPKPEVAGAGSSVSTPSAGPPPRSPRKKKKRSGRRR
ncbi:MAG TPA: YidC/Oxa1 family membrane protein insertase [Solirubrobacteraceae bacterium]|jgi:YidC/Oxa1 family membrane protein insertase|nr:YidC/Oxa1 family membrane protein insertase [Solirubrobacteraceae bacterium]